MAKTKVNEFKTSKRAWFEVTVASKGQFVFIRSFETDPRVNEEAAKAVKAAGGNLARASYSFTDASDVA